MQTYRLVPRTAPRACRAATGCASTPSSSAAASRALFTTPFFHPYNSSNNVNNVTAYGYGANNGFNPVAELAPLFRVLDSAVAELTSAVAGEEQDEDHQQQSTTTKRQHRRHPYSRGSSSFTPRFDVKEVASGYELHGELPGLEQGDLAIEFEDEKTLVIRGRSVRETETETGSRSGDVADSAAVTPAAASTIEAAPTTDNTDAASEKSGGYQKASVAEDEDDFVDVAGPAAEDKGKAVESAATPDKTQTQTAAAAAPAQPQRPQSKYWISERSVGEFERRFSFPGRVDQDAVTASLKNGILSVIVPKLVKREEGVRRIEIQ